MLGKNILHAEDEPDDVTIFDRALKQALSPHTVHWVDNGESAIAWLGGKEEFADRARFPLPDVLILDLKMPKKSGFDVLQWVRNSTAFRHLPVIILSSSDDPKDVRRAQELGATTYFFKSVSYQDVIEYLRQIS
jgi:CheY-like chemotaxis protein